MSRSHLKLEALEARQLLAGVTGGGTEVGTDIHHPNGNVYDQVLMTGSSVAVTADAGQITRVSFLDMQGDIVQAEFSGAGQLTVSLANATSDVAPDNYVQSGVKYEQGLATFTITGEDASTNFNVFSVGKGNAVNAGLFDSTHTGGDHWANIARLTVVADPANPNGSLMGSIYAGNAVFSADSGVTGITAANVQVQNVVRIGNLDATGTATPALTFGKQSQFGSVDVAGGDLIQSNGKSINNSDSYAFQINSIANVDSSGADVSAKTITGVSFTEGDPVGGGAKTFNLTTAIDNIVGTSGDDVINASNTDSSIVVGALDSIDGGAGNDTLNISDSSATGATLGGLTVKNVENFLYTSTKGLGAGDTADTSGWTGLTSATLTLQDIGNDAQSYTADKGTAVTINSNSTAAAGAWTINGGSTVKLTNSTSTTAGTDGVTVNGAVGTTSVDVTQTQKDHAHNANLGQIDIYDANGTEAAKDGTITSVTVNGSDNGVYIVDNALTSLNLTNVTDWAQVNDNLDAHASADGATTLAVSLNTVDLSGSGFWDGVGTIKQINFTTSGGDSAVPVKTANDALTGISVTGDKHLDLSGSSLGSNFATLTASGAGGVKATVGAGVSVTTDAGADAITFTAAPKHAVALGAGDDWVQVPLTGSGTKLDGGSLDGGAGTDTLSLTAGDAKTATAGTTLAGQITGFEKLELVAGGTAGEVNLHNLDDINQVVLAGNLGGAYSLTHLASGASLTVKSDQAGAGTVDVPVSAIQNETLTLNITSGGNVAANTIHTGLITTVNLTATDTDSGTPSSVDSVTIPDAKTINISGSVNQLTVVGGDSATAIDASAMSKGALFFTSGTIAGGTISGTTHGANNITATAATKAVTITTGGSADTIHTGTHGATITSGDGGDSITADGGDNTITTGKDNDTIAIGGTGTNTVTSGDGDDVITVEGAAVSTITLGGGNDKVVLNSVAGKSGYFTSITGAGDGDKLDLHLVAHGSVTTDGTNLDGAHGQITLGQGSSFSDYVAAATAGDGHTNSIVKWFNFNGDTYVVVDNSGDGTVAGNVYNPANDVVIRLTGTLNLGSGSTNFATDATGVITI